MNKANIEDIYRLTPLQQGMLFHSLYEPEAEIGFEQTSCRLEGELDVEAFARAWSAVVQRHTVLRTAFVWEGVKEPLQVVQRRVELPLRQEDWRGVSDQEQRLRDYLKADRERGIDLKQAPLMRLSLLRLGEQSYQLVWSRHHLLLDGWSRPLLMKEVLSYYDLFRKGVQPELRPARPYREYIAWLQKQDQKGPEQYWRNQLQGLQQATELVRSVGRERAAASDEERYAHVTRHLSAESSARLQMLCREQKLTMNTVLQGAWAVLLSRYVGCEEVVYGAVVAGRPAELIGVEQMIGLFINTLPVRVQVAANERVGTWLQQLQVAQVEMRQYEYSSLAQIQNWSGVNGGRLFDSIFVFENFPTSDYMSAATGDLRITSAEILAERSGYPVTLIAERRERLTLQLRYDRWAFDEETIEGLLGHFENVLSAIVADPEQRVGELSLLSDTERQQLIVDWNDTAVAYDEAYLPELITAQAEQSPDAVALVCGDEQFTYAELNERANSLGHYLRSRGVGPDVCVGLCVERSLEMIVGVLGILKAGGAYVPLEPTYPQERLQFMVADAGLTLVLTQEKHRMQLASCEVVSLDAQWPEIAVHSRENFASGVSGENLAYVIYTSGSTGQPKGAMNRHAGLSNRLQWMQEAYGLTSADHVIHKTPYTFDVSVWELLWPLQMGARLVMAAPDGHRDRDYLLQEIERQEITLLHFVPSMLKVFVDGAEAGERCRSVRCIVSSGEALGTELVNDVRERLGVRLENLYGPTEAAIDVTVWSCEARADGKVPIGKPISNTELFVLDGAQELAPVGVKGELYLGGAGLARGYLGRAELTAEKFVPHPYSREAGARLYRTGDVVRYLADGNVEYLGRADNQVKIRGFRIELGEVEAVLNEHAGIKQAVVVTKDQRLVAYVVPQNGSGSSEWRQFLQQRLPEYMVPAVFVSLENIPLSSNGKVDRRSLPEPESAVAGETARTPTEELLCGIWSEVLNRAETGVNENFFELGGHSLLATQVLSRIQAVFQIELPLRTLFEAPTVRELAARVESGSVNVVPPLKRVSRDEPLPLSFAQQRLWFLAELEPDSAFYNSPLAVRLKGELQLSALEQTLNELLRRHEVLRTSFVTEQGKPRQVINEVSPQALEVIDLSDVEEREAAVRELAARESSQPFDLSRGPLLRLKVARLRDEEHVLFLTMHHIVSDGWSTGVLIKEVSELYSAYATGRDPDLKELPIQYADYASWQREWLQGDVLEEQMKYWTEQLAGAPKVLELPTDRVRPAVQTFCGKQEKFSLDEATSAALKDLSRREGVTMFMLLLAAFQLLLMRYTNQEDVVVGTPVAARRHKEVEDLIGFFVNTLVLRTNLSGDPAFKELLKRVREVCLGAYSHQDVPFEKLVEATQPKRDLDVPPLVQVALGLQNGPQVVANLAGLQTSLLNPEHETVRYDLTVWVMEGARALHFLWTYNSDLFEARTIRLMARRFGTLLRKIVDHPAERLSALEMVTETEKSEQLVEEKAIANRIVEKLVRTQRKAIQVPVAT